MVDMDGRYSRQELFAPIGTAGQAKIRRARVLLAGCGGLGTVSADLLARAGVGVLRIVDRDIVEMSNLQRQTLYDENDARERTPKAVAAARRLGMVNSDVRYEAVVADIGPKNIAGLLDGIDIVVDGFDNFAGRYVLNDACVERGIPWVYGGCVGSYGLSAMIVPGKTQCLRCMFPEPPDMGSSPTCDTAGVIGPIPHVIAATQVARALRWIVSGDAGDGSIVSADVWDERFDTLKVSYQGPDGNCPCCVERRFDFLNSPGAQTTSLCGRNSVQVCPDSPTRPDFAAIAEQLSAIGTVQANEYLLRFELPPHELTLFTDGRAIVKGTTDATEARSLIARYFGV